MAREVTMSIRMAWWVRPYLWAAALFARSVEPFIELDSDGLERLIEVQSKFIAKHGVRFYLNGKRI